MRISDWSSDVCSSDLPRRSFAGGQPMVFALGDDNMVDEFDVERPADVAQEFGDANVAVARGRVTAWMIMDQQDSRRVQFERSEEHTSELQSLMRISYAVFCLKKKTKIHHK